MMMMKRLRILTSSSIISARILRDSMQEILNERILVTRSPRVDSQFIRYGNSSASTGIDLGYNSAEFIQLCNKARFSKLAQDNEVYSPIFYRRIYPEAFPVLIRTTLSGYGGDGIIYCNGKDQFDENYKDYYYWTPFVKMEWELRVHVLAGVPAKIFKKIPQDDTNPIRNNSCCHFSQRSVETYPKLIDLCGKLYDITHGDYFALDVGWDKAKREYFVIELNSAPGLNENTAKIYAEFILKGLGKHE